MKPLSSFFFTSLFKGSKSDFGSLFSCFFESSVDYVKKEGKKGGGRTPAISPEKKKKKKRGLKDERGCKRCLISVSVYPKDSFLALPTPEGSIDFS